MCRPHFVLDHSRICSNEPGHTLHVALEANHIWTVQQMRPERIVSHLPARLRRAPTSASSHNWRVFFWMKATRVGRALCSGRFYCVLWSSALFCVYLIMPLVSVWVPKWQCHEQTNCLTSLHRERRLLPPMVSFTPVQSGVHLPSMPAPFISRLNVVKKKKKRKEIWLIFKLKAVLRWNSTFHKSSHIWEHYTIFVSVLFQSAGKMKQTQTHTEKW